MRNRNTIEYLGIWEQLYNPDFKPTEFEGFKMQAGLNAFTLSPKKWIEATNAVGIIAKSVRYGGTYAHKDIAFKFASWISVEFELYIVKEFQRLKTEEQTLIGWTAKRELSKINYRIHTDAIKTHLFTAEITREQASRGLADALLVANTGAVCHILECVAYADNREHEEVGAVLNYTAKLPLLIRRVKDTESQKNFVNLQKNQE